jgi:hypothetical protein
MGVRIMSRLFLAVVLVSALSGITFFILNSLLVQTDFAGTIYEQGIPLAISAFLFILLPYVHQLLSGRRSRLSLTALPGSAVPFQDYTLPWYQMLTYGSFFVYAASGLGIFIIWLAGLVTGIFITELVPFLNGLFVAVTFFGVGSWIGARVEKYSVLAVLGTVLVYHLIAVVVNLLLGIRFSYLLLVGAIFLYLVAAILGLWRGRRTRIPRYIQYLLLSLPPGKRPAAVEGIYRQVNGLSGEDKISADIEAFDEEIGPAI